MNIPNNMMGGPGGPPPMQNFNTMNMGAAAQMNFQ